MAAKPVMKAMKAQAMKAMEAKATNPAMKTMKVKTAAPAMKVMKATKKKNAAPAMKTMKDAAKAMVLIKWLVAANEMVDMADEVGRHGLRGWAGYGGMV